MVTENMIRSCLNNWLGYGNINAPIWFMGMEEGGAEIWRHGTHSLASSLLTRSQFNLAMDFRHVWEDLYHIPLENFVKRRGALTTWHFMAAFLVSLEGHLPETNKIRDFVFKKKKIGRLEGEHFLCEFLPLPRNSNSSIDHYNIIWKSNKNYVQDVGPNRFILIRDTLVSKEGVKLLISYDKAFSGQILSYYDNALIEEWMDGKGKMYKLYELVLTPKRKIKLLITPFFGQGQANYEGLYLAAQKVKHMI
jgi:hypothetical protein